MASFTKFQQRNGTNCEIKNTRNFVVSNSLGKYHLNMYVMKARMPRCVQNYSETHSTGVTGLHSWLRRSHNPVTQSIVFHCHFAHTCAFLLYWHISRPKWVRPNQNCISKHCWKMMYIFFQHQRVMQHPCQGAWKTRLFLLYKSSHYSSLRLQP